MFNINHPFDQPPAMLCWAFYIAWYCSQNRQLFWFFAPLFFGRLGAFLFPLWAVPLEPLPRWWSIWQSSGRLLPTSERARRSWWRLRLLPSMVSCGTLCAARGWFRGIRVTYNCSQRNAEQSRMQSLRCHCCAAAVGGSWFNQVWVPFFCKAIKNSQMVKNKNNLRK